MTTISDPLPRYDLEINAGRAVQIDIPVLDGGAPVPAAGLTGARAQVRSSIDDELVLWTWGTDEDPANAEITGTTAGAVRLFATSEETTSWQLLWPGSFGQVVVWFDVEIVDTDGARHQITAPSTLTLIHQVTR